VSGTFSGYPPTASITAADPEKVPDTFFETNASNAKKPTEAQAPRLHFEMDFDRPKGPVYSLAGSDRVT
jgi:hypothetical protein